jgi:SrtB family sortase
VLEDLHLSNRLEEKKKSLIQGFMLAVRGFNEKHRATAKVVTVLALVLIALLSALFTCAIFVCSLFNRTTSTGKRIAGIAMAVVLLCVAIFASQKITGLEKPVTVNSGEKISQISATSEEKEVEVESIGTVNTDIKADENDVSTQELPNQDIDNAEISTANDGVEEQNEAGSEATASEVTASEATTPAAAPSETDPTSTPSASWNTSDIDLKELMDAYPEMIGWVYFEDGHISYPIMQTSDNEKYRSLDYMGGEASTGAIFLDYRSAADFTDANSIIYGHNMKDGTMFGSLREYRKDPAYYNDHMYFQVITPDKAYRYLIFEYMDVAENYVLYDYVSDAALEFVKDAEPVRIKSYMDSEIPVKEGSKVVTLSTCTRKDDLQFVVLGVLVDEDEN